MFASKYPYFHLVYSDPSYYTMNRRFLNYQKGNVSVVYRTLSVCNHRHLLTRQYHDSTKHDTTNDDLSPYYIYVALTEDSFILMLVLYSGNSVYTSMITK